MMNRLYLLVVATLIAGCAVKLKYTGDCYYSESRGDIRIDSIEFFTNELNAVRASKDTALLMLFFNPNAGVKTMIKLNIASGQVSAYKIAPYLRKELRLDKNDAIEIHRAFQGSLLSGNFLQQCKSLSFDGTANLIHINYGGSDELLYFSPYDSPLRLDLESRKSLGGTFKLIEIASGLYWRD